MEYLYHFPIQYPRRQNNLSVIFSGQLMATYIRVGRFRLKDRCFRDVGSRRSRSRHEYMLMRSAVPDTRWPQRSAPRVHSTLLSHLTPFIPARHFSLIVAILLSTCDAKCRVGAERESNREKQRGPCRRKRRR